MWLIASWALALSIRSVAGASRLMVYAAWVGLMLVWPTIELSLSPSVQRSDEGTCRGVSVVWVLSQWVSLNAVFQVVAWPMRLYAGWDIDQTIWLTVATAAWSLVVALAVGWGVGARVGRSVRAVLAMVFVVLVFFAEPMVIALLQPTHWPMRIAPWEVLWQLTREPADYAGLGQAPVTILCVGAAGALGWCVLWIAQFAGHGVVSTQATPHAD
ncbi:MAG: hypothetical protein GC164_03445 [Phycisphaera sp.]|nr:hypothetical protein [Phycisphaera sp.]